MSNKPVSVTIECHDPNTTTPPFGKPIMVWFGAVHYNGSTRREYHDLRVVTIYVMDIDGSSREGVEMKRELEAGKAKWSHLQFMMEDGEGDEVADATSDAIEWWAEVPTLPLHDKSRPDARADDAELFGDADQSELDEDAEQAGDDDGN